MRRLPILLLMIITLVLGGCATKNWVRTETGAVEQRMTKRVTDAEGQVKSTQSRLDGQVAKHDQDVTEISKTARQALERANAAGKLAEGKFLYEKVLTDENVRFGFDRSRLSDEAKAALQSFAAKIKTQNQGVYIEIQGHTDSVDSEAYNHRLGLRRAEAVRRFLNREQGFPLHRMSVISYGESEPAVKNDTPENRARNRRVALVVLK